MFLHVQIPEGSPDQAVGEYPAASLVLKSFLKYNLFRAVLSQILSQLNLNVSSTHLTKYVCTQNVRDPSFSFVMNFFAI